MFANDAGSEKDAVTAYIFFTTERSEEMDNDDVHFYLAVKSTINADSLARKAGPNPTLLASLTNSTV